MNRKPFAFLTAIVAPLFLQGCLEDLQPPIYNSPPTSPPIAVEFVDTSLGEGIGGAIEITRAADESSFASYMIRWGTAGVPAGDAQGIMLDGNLNFIARVSKTRAEAVYYLPAETDIPEGVDSIVVSSYNPLGESGVVSVLIDNLIDLPRTPETRASNLTVSDSNEFAIIDASLSFESAFDESDINYYLLRYADDQGCPLPGEPAATYLAGETITISDQLYLGYPPYNARNLLLVTGNDLGEHTEADCNNYISAPEGEWNYIDYNQPAKEAPSALTIEDVNPELALSLEINVSPAQFELDIRHYSVYLGSGSHCQLIGQLPKGGGTLTYELSHEEYSETEASPFNPAWVSYPNQIVTVVSDGENCFQFPQLSATYSEDSGIWHLIYLVEGEETTEINNHYDSIDIPYDAAINEGWDARCMSVTGTAQDPAPELVTASCNRNDGRQRFAVVTTENSENPDLHTIVSLFNGKCFARTADDGEDNWLLEECDGANALQHMELESDGVNLDNKQIAVYRSAEETACAQTGSGRDDVYGEWGNCGATTGVYWQFWQQAMPSERQRFADDGQ